MENIILLILFTYPGAFAEFTYRHFSKDRPFYHEPDGMFRTARIFFLSAVISLISLKIFGFIHHEPLGLSTSVSFLSDGNNALYYTMCSFFVSILTGAVWYGMACFVESKRNNKRLSDGKAPNGKKKQVWMSMIADPDTPQMNYAVEIRKHGEMVQCGLIYHMPDDLRTDTGFALMHCDLVKRYMDNPEYDLISDPLISYIDLEHDAEIVIRDAEKFAKWMAGELAEE